MLCVFCCEDLPWWTKLLSAMKLLLPRQDAILGLSVNNKSGMGFEAGKYGWGDIRDVTLRLDRDQGYPCV